MTTTFTIDKSTRLLFIDSNEQWVKAFEILIPQNENYKIVGNLTSLKDNIDQIFELQPHIILIDIDSLNEEEIDSIRWIRINNPNIQILPYAENPGEEHIIKAIEQGACGFLIGVRSNYKILLNGIQKIHLGEAPLSGNVSRILVGRLNKSTNLGLTPMELKVLQELKTGKTSSEIADGFGLSKSTIRTHMGKIYDKLGVHNKSEAIAKL